MAIPAERRGDDSSRDVAVVIREMTHRLGELGNTIESLRGMVLLNREYTQGLKSLVPTIYGVDRAAHLFRRQLEAMTKAMKGHGTGGAAGAASGAVVGGLALVMEGMHGIAQKAIGPLSAMTSAIDRMTGAASPDVWATLTGSFQMVAAVAGTMVLPQVIQVIRWVQQLAFWLRALDPAWKEVIGNVIVAAGVLLALGVVLGPIIAVGGGLIAVLRLVVTGVLYVVGTFAALTVRLLMLAPAALVAMAAIAALIWTLNRVGSENQDLKDANKRSAKWATTGEAPEEAARGHWSVKQLAAMAPEQREAIVQTWRDAARQNEIAASNQMIDWSNKNSDRSGINVAWGRVFGSRTEENAHATARLAGDWSKERAILDRVLSAVKSGKFENLSKDPAIRSMDSMEKMLLSLQTQGQPKFGAIDDVYRSIQVSALKDNTMEQFMKQMWNEQRQLLLDQLAVQKEIRDKKADPTAD